MANYATLKAAIDAVIKTNGNQEITGAVLNNVLTAMVNSLGANYQFAGVAVPSTNPGTPDQNVFYIAMQAGTYANFGGHVLSSGITFFLWDGTWNTENYQISLSNGSITTSKIADGAITMAKIEDGAVTNNKIFNSSVTTEKIAGGAVTSDELYNNAVTTPKIVNGAVTTPKIAGGAVTTEKIADYAVETSKIGDRAVTSIKIDTGAVTTSKIDDRAVTFEKLDPNMIDDVATPDSVNLINSGGVRDSIDEAVAGMSIDITEYIQDDTKNLKVGGYNYTYGRTPLDVFVYQVSSVGVIPTVYVLFRSSDGTYFLFSGILDLQEQTVTYKETYNTFGDLPGRAQRAVYAGADNTPTANSQNIVKSGGVYAAVAEAFANLIQKLQNGEVIPALAENLASWAGSTQNANYTQENVVETTGGDLSIDSSVPATLMSIAAKTDFSATKLVATGFNILRRATAVGNGWYFMVPALPYGAINTATQPNGVLFTNSEHENLHPTVYFKPLASGVPTSVTDGTACAYTDASTDGKSYRFYTTSQAGYIIVSGIDRATTCAHIGWSKRYDEYFSVTDPNDAGSEVNIAAGIHALHSYDKMLTVGNSADRMERTGDNQVTWHRLVDRVQPTWTTTPVESEGEPTGDYIHTATISGMKSGGAAAFETLDITLLVDGTTISFTDQNSSVENDYVKYELATEATGTAAVSSSFSVEDWGLIIIEGAVGSAYINIAYAQGIPDSVRQMLSNIDNKTIPVIAEALLYLYNENKALRELLTGKNNAVLPYIKAQTIECYDMLTMGVPDVLVCSEAGAPSAANVPDNWDETTMTVWNGCPRKIGQQYIDKASGKVYYAIKVTGSTNDWVVLN